MSNPYLEGNFGPVTDEVTLTDLRVTGTIPEQLTGRYLRNGPNPVTPPDPTPTTGSSATAWSTACASTPVGPSGTATGGSAAAPSPTRSARQRPPDPSTERHGLRPQHQRRSATPARRWPSSRRGPLPYELSYELDTIGPTDFGGRLDAGYTAHPKVDPATGELHAVSYFWGWGNQVQYTVVDTAGQGRAKRIVETDRQPDAARHVAHRALRRRLRPARRLRPRRGDGAASSPAVLLEATTTRPASG